MTYQIRSARLTDAPALAELVREIGYFSQINEETPEATQAHIARDLAISAGNDRQNIYVAESDAGEVLGYLSVHWVPYLIHRGPEGYISELFIRESARGQGVGTQLLDTAVNEARLRGCDRLMLVNMRHRESYQREFYKKHGWEERPDAANFVLTL